MVPWGYASKTRLDCLCIRQNKCLHLIFFAHPRERLTVLCEMKRNQNEMKPNQL